MWRCIWFCWWGQRCTGLIHIKVNLLPFRRRYVCSELGDDLRVSLRHIMRMLHCWNRLSRPWLLYHFALFASTVFRSLLLLDWLELLCAVDRCIVCHVLLVFGFLTRCCFDDDGLALLQPRFFHDLFKSEPLLWVHGQKSFYDAHSVDREERRDLIVAFEDFLVEQGCL